MKKLTQKSSFNTIVMAAFLSLVSFKSVRQTENIFADNSDSEISGVYVLTSCENSIFKIKIEKKAGAYFFFNF
ncbi:hypothetical protein [Flavobacterium sp. RS13.1]|jgi:hypothetical protein|uniref:hypothetical protein n=1 Tax=Flavobacterium sp. RS13.1 TaxID=3400345 RepID=UPI003AAD6B6C